MAEALDEKTVTAVRALLAGARRVLFITGAGVSADSGLPTYRGVGGLYEGKATEDGYTIEEALSATVFRRHPDITWKYLWEIGAACRRARPNRAHEIIAEIESAKPESWVLTQNIDGFHHEAGSRHLIEVHGRASRLYCLRCGEPYTPEQVLAGYVAPVTLPPRCACGGVIRPDVVLFEEMLPTEALERMAALDENPPDLVMVIGTSGQFPYIAQPVWRARMRGAPSVEINPESTALSKIVTHRLAGGAAEVLEQLWP